MNTNDVMYFPGKLLVAMPYLQDDNLYHSIIYICGTDIAGSMGLILNKQLIGVTLNELLKQVDIQTQIDFARNAIMYGGAQESNRGFVLHSLDYHATGTVAVDESIGITSTLDILKAIAEGDGPQQKVIALGYVNWKPGQLEAEITDNKWLLIQPTTDLIFGTPPELMWRAAMSAIGVDPMMLTLQFGHA